MKSKKINKLYLILILAYFAGSTFGKVMSDLIGCGNCNIFFDIIPTTTQ